eukprot:9504124-Pyramimonas_sp.AAC.2
MEDVPDKFGDTPLMSASTGWVPLLLSGMYPPPFLLSAASTPTTRTLSPYYVCPLRIYYLPWYPLYYYTAYAQVPSYCPGPLLSTSTTGGRIRPGAPNVGSCWRLEAP